MTPAPPSPVVASVRRGRLWLEATAIRAGADVAVTVIGGDRPHIGCVVLAIAHPSTDDPQRASVTSSVLAMPPHREETLARPLAETLARSLRATVVVAAGVHTDGLEGKEVAAYLEIGNDLAAALVQALSAGP